jgi:hypothetical protein
MTSGLSVVSGVRYGWPWLKLASQQKEGVRPRFEGEGDSVSGV